MRISDIAAAAGGQLKILGDASAEAEAFGLVVDSRKVVPGCVFLATRGARVDGHDFIGRALEAGAACIMCEQVPEEVRAGAFVVVEDSFKALKDLAAWYRTTLSCRIIGIIGSVGKTSTKELVASVMAQHFITQKTEGNFNNEVGVPLTLLAIRPDTRVAVVEMGISDFGEMTRLGRIVRPDVVVMTNIGPCHLEFLGDLDGVLRAKTEVIPYIKEGGLLVLNREDPKLASVTQAEGKTLLYYGVGGAAEADNLVSLGLEGTSFDLKLEAETIRTIEGVKVPLPGRHMVQNALAAAIVGMRLGLTDEEIRRGIETVKPVSGRSNLIKAEGYLLVDDCYNANPKSMKAAVDLMKSALGRRVAVLGDMFELGSDEDRLHAEVGEYAVSNEIDLLICVGKLSKHMFEAALEARKAKSLTTDIRYYENLTEAMEAIPALIQEGDTVLIKASHGMNFAELVKALA